MKYKKPITFISRVLIGVCAVLVIWRPLVELTYAFARGPDARFDLGGDYELWGPSLAIIRWPVPGNKDEYGFDNVIAGPVKKFAMTGPWIVGTTPEGWFGINKESNEVLRADSKEKLQEATGLDLALVQMETDPRPYEILHPGVRAAIARANRLCWIMLFVLPITLGFGPLLIRRRKTAAPKPDR